ncbi:uncharacterized protein LOC122382599 [Amphibalanus amphitrite]|uniref:uncharacterized protein LOC122382599 n=1 Tax=Amphibalanus amphitrite TaxID=1232801 RepID=UPI001C929B7F|nr:uncharacterized protein LOC122382599 [Amphibalanus amphitrite]XP_043224088.1 uncharacterized protein LOC122382599 [Amphibalanus amphitrite]XP_043224089.1 uncharacterized protein LOC122382599 [Amphibalanus amphitrite]
MKVPLTWLLVLLVILVTLVPPSTPARRWRRFRIRVPRAMHALRRVGKESYSRERFLAIPQIPYPYYQRPRYRYPFYDRYGHGKLLYGYGDGHLYTYTQFKPLDGYSKRR